MRRALATAGLLAVLAGCGSPAAPAPAPAPTAPAPTPDQASCSGYEETMSTVSGFAEQLSKGPILPVTVALFLLDARGKAATPGIIDTELAAAQAELVAAIDDLDAQGNAKLPPGGNAAQDLVRLDATRIVAAAKAVEPLCARPR